MDELRTLHREVYPAPDESLKLLPVGVTHYALRRLADGPAVDFWRLGTEEERQVFDLPIEGELHLRPLSPRPGTTWTAFCDAMPELHRKLLVTNNLEARDAYGFASHVWLVDMVHFYTERFVWNGDVFAEAGETIARVGLRDPYLRHLTHWRYALPEEG